MKERPEATSVAAVDDSDGHKGGLLARIPRRVRTGIAVVTAVASASAFIVGCGDAADALPTLTTISAPDQPATTGPETVATVEQTGEFTVESLEIDAELMNDPRLLFDTVADRITQWYNAGATLDLVEGDKQQYDRDAYIQGIVSGIDEAFIEALFIDDWQENQELSDVVFDTIVSHAGALENYIITSDNVNYPNKQPYRAEVKVNDMTGSELSEDGLLTITGSWQDVDNREYNTMITAPNLTDRLSHPVSITFRVVDGAVKIVDIHRN